VNKKNKKMLPKLLFTNSKLNVFQKEKLQRNDQTFGSIINLYLFCKIKRVIYIKINGQII